MERKWELNSRFSSVGYTNLLARWNQLFEFMVVKYNDMIIKPTDKNGTFKKTPSGGRSQLSSGSPIYSKITATCRGEKYWQPTRYPCFFNSSHKGMQRLIQSIRWRRAVALLVASGKKSKPNSVLLYIRFDISISKLHLRMMILEKAIQGLGYIGTGSDLFMLHFTFVQVIILADKPVVQLA